MFWIFMLFFGGAASFATLGMYYTLFKVMSLALMASGVTVLLLLALLLWRRFAQK